MNHSAASADHKDSNYRYSLFFRGQFLVLAGYLIVITETLIAVALGITSITVRETLVLSVVVVGSSLLMILAVYIKKRISPAHEWSIFVLYVLIYLSSYCYWIYRLQELRILGLLSALTAVTVVLTYTNMVQSLMMSLSTLVCHYAVLYYSMVIRSQPGTLAREVFISCCLIPAFFLISVAAYYMNKKREETLRVKNELEATNSVLNEANAMLRYEQARSKIEMDLAHDIQKSFFPSLPPVDSSWDAAFISVPSAGVSGDFYDFYYSGETLKGLSLFDVSGHGVAPALITILAKPVLYRNFKSMLNCGLDKMVERSNDDLHTQLEEVHSFITGIVLRFCGNSIEYVNAGHPDLLFRPAGSPAVRKINNGSEMFKGHPIGITSPGLSYSTHKFQAQSGDMFILYSDCFLDCRNNEGAYYGESRLSESFAAAKGETAGDVLDAIVNDLFQFAEGCCINDDMTLIVLRKK